MGLNINDYMYIISGIFGTYITYRFMRLFFDSRRTSPIIEFISYLVYFLLITIIYYSFNTPILNLLTNILLFFALTFNYNTGMKNRILSILFVYMILIFIENIIALLSGYIYSSIYSENPHYSSIIGMVTLRIVSFITVLVLGNFKDIKEGIDISNAYWVSIFLIPLGSLYIFIALFQSRAISASILLTCTIILFSIIITSFYLYDALNKLFKEKIETMALREQNKYYQSQIETINSSYKNIKSLRHDMNNHIAVLNNYIVTDEKDKAMTYISDIKDMSDETQMLSNTGNMDIDSILNYKLQEAKSKGIIVSLKTKVPSNFNILAVDMVVIIGNLLDNAIEACSRVDNDKRIHINIRYSEGSLFIFTKNTYDGSVEYKDGKIKTTKKDSGNHGIGLNNIESILKKYNGIMKINHTDYIFNVDIMMYIK